MPKAARYILAITLGLLLGLVALRYVEPRLPTTPYVRGLKIDGQVLPSGTAVSPWLAQRAASYGERPLTLVHEDQTFDSHYGKLGLAIDTEDVLARARAIGHRGSWWRRLREVERARRGEVDLPLSYRFDAAAARRHITAYRSEVARAPVDAKLDLINHRTVADQAGCELDIDATVAAIEEFHDQRDRFELLTTAIPAAITVKTLDSLDVSKVLASFETKYQLFKRGRSANVELAARLLNGLIIRPGQLISFNERVGPRTLDRGFTYAPEIVGDELTVGVGGGTCQVSSTLHAAALYGGFGVVKRKSHSRPSSYIKLGLDATVSYPRVDLELRNPYKFAVIVHALVPEKGTLRVELLGGTAVDEVEYKYGVARVEEFVRRITVRNHLEAGKVKRRQKGTRGMDVFSFLTIRYRDGRIEKRRYFSGYRPSPEVYWVAPDYDEEALPGLPRWAKGVEGKLEADGTDVYPTSG